LVFTVIVEAGSPAKGGDGMKAQAWERLEIVCVFLMPETVLSGEAAVS
jgi:hypothetical protein